MDGNKQKVKMEVTPIVHDGQPNWELTIVDTGKKGGPGSYPEVAVSQKKTGDFEITIINGNGITFSGDPIWIQAGKAKPTAHVIDPQITDISGQNSTKLKFKDANSGLPMDLTYRLNFSNDAPPLDPIILNGGGGGQSYDYLLYGAAVFLLGALLLALFSRKRLTREPVQPTDLNKP
jgi:hypothetical protein